MQSKIAVEKNGDFRYQIVGAVCVIAINFCFWPVIKTFIKIAEMQIPYLVAVIVLTCIGQLVFQRYLKNHAGRGFVGGLLVGFLASFVALQIAKLFDRSGPYAAFRGAGDFSALSMMAVDGVEALLLGGWLAGALAAGAMYQFRNRRR